MVHLLYFHLFSEKLVLIFLIKYVLTQIKIVDFTMNPLN